MNKLLILFSILLLTGCTSDLTTDFEVEEENTPPLVDLIPPLTQDDLIPEVEEEVYNSYYHELLLSYVFIDVINLNKIDLPTSILNEHIIWTNNNKEITSLTGLNTTYYIKANIGNVSRNFNITFSNNEVSTIYQQDLLFHYYFVNDSKKLGTSMNPNKIVIHNTANTASAYNEIMYLNSTSNTSSVSYHYAVDDIGIYQGVRSNTYAHHAGNLNVNKESIGIEIAKSMISDNTIKNKAIYNAQRLIRLLQMEHNINTLLTHYDVTNKHCPHDILDRYDINVFYNELELMYDKI